MLLGRGTPFNVHSGNKKLHEILNNHYEEYDRCNSSKDKTMIAEKIVKMVQKKSGRFLKKNDLTSTWEEISDVEARAKVSHGFRRIREVLNFNKALNFNKVVSVACKRCFLRAVTQRCCCNVFYPIGQPYRPLTKIWAMDLTLDSTWD